MTPNGHLNVGVACIQTGCRVSGCQFLKIVAMMFTHGSQNIIATGDCFLEREKIPLIHKQ